MKISITEKNKKIIRGVCTPLFWLALWQAVAFFCHSEVIVPYPFTVAKRLFFLALTQKFWVAVSLSIVRIFFGYVLGSVFGVLFALVCRKSVTKSLFSPMKTVIKATPVASFIMLAWVWFKRDTIPVFVSALMVMPVVWGNTETGLNSISREIKEFAKAYSVKGLGKIKHIVIPSVMPYFASAMCTCAGLVWKAGVAAEVLCQPKNSIGANLYNAKNIMETADVFAWTVTVIIISLLLEKIIKKLLGKLNKGGKVQC